MPSQQQLCYNGLQYGIVLQEESELCMAVLEDGQSIAHYRITHYLGSGFSGESYEAEDTQLQRKVALKLLHPWGRLPEIARRQFFRDMQGLSLLTHPYIAATFDYGETSDHLYIARRFVGPGSLLGSEGRLWFRPPFEVSDAFQYAHQLAQALFHVHNQGYSHGALTLANILVLQGQKIDDDSEFTPFLLADVGVASFMRRFGLPPTALYAVTAAPEQFEGRTVPASDQYALAVLLFLWLSGRLPFIGSPAEVAQLKHDESIPSLILMNPRVSLQQEGMLRRALSAHPEERYPSILAFTQALLASIPPAELIPQVPDTPAINTEPLQPLIPELPYTSMEAVITHAEVMPPVYDIPAQPNANTQGEEATHAEIDEQSFIPSLPPHLLITHPDSESTQIIALEQDVITLGRAGSSDILLDQDPSVSRHHARIQRDGTHYLLFDQSSTLGVFVNGEQLADGVAYNLCDNDDIMIGEYMLVFHRHAIDSTPDPLSTQVIS